LARALRDECPSEVPESPHPVPAEGLREQILSHDAQPGRPSPYGQKYEILGPLTGPNGKNAWVRTIWIVLTGETAPRLVTLIPAEKP